MADNNNKNYWKPNPRIIGLGTNSLIDTHSSEENDRAKELRKIIDLYDHRKRNEDSYGRIGNYIDSEFILQATGKSAKNMELELDNEEEIDISDIKGFYQDNTVRTSVFENFLNTEASKGDYIDIMSGRYSQLGMGPYLIYISKILERSSLNNPNNNESVFKELSKPESAAALSEDVLEYSKKNLLGKYNLGWSTINGALKDIKWGSKSLILSNKNLKDEHVYKLVESHPEFIAKNIASNSIKNNHIDRLLNNDDNWKFLHASDIRAVVDGKIRENSHDGNVVGDERDKVDPSFASKLLKNGTKHIGEENLNIALGSIDEESRNIFINAKLGITNGSYSEVSPEDENFNEDNWDNWDNGDDDTFVNDYDSNISSMLSGSSTHLNEDQIEHIKRHGSFDDKYSLYHNENIDPRHGVEMYRKWANNDETHGYDSNELVERFKEDKDDILNFNDLPDNVQEEIRTSDAYYDYVDTNAEEMYTLDDYVRDHEDEIVERMGSDYDDNDVLVEKLVENYDWESDNPNSSQNVGNKTFDALEKLKGNFDSSELMDLESFQDYTGLKHPKELGLPYDKEGDSIDIDHVNDEINKFGGPSSIDFSNNDEYEISEHPDYEERYEEEAKSHRQDLLNGDKYNEIVDGLYLYEDHIESNGYIDAMGEARNNFIDDVDLYSGYMEDSYENSHKDDRFVPRHLADHIPEIQDIRRERGKQSKSSNITSIKDRDFSHSYGEDQHYYELAKDYADANNGSIDIGKLHKKFPNLKDTWKKIFAGKGKLSSEEIDEKINDIPKTDYDISYGNWSSYKMQNLNSRGQIIFRLDHSEDSLKPIYEHENEGVKEMFDKVQKVSKQSGHPTNDRTIAWARVDISDPKHWMIDELQSDFGKKVTQYLKEEGHGEKADAIHTIESFHKNWRENLINHILKTAKKHDAEKVSTHSPESKHSHASYDGSNVHSVYKDSYKKVPRKMGFTPSHHEELPLTEKGKKHFEREVDLEPYTDGYFHHKLNSGLHGDLAENHEEGSQLYNNHKEMAEKHSVLANKFGASLKSHNQKIDLPKYGEMKKPDADLSAAKDSAKTNIFNSFKSDKLAGKSIKDPSFEGNTFDLTPSLLKKNLKMIDDLIKMESIFVKNLEEGCLDTDVLVNIRDIRGKLCC